MVQTRSARKSLAPGAAGLSSSSSPPLVPAAFLGLAEWVTFLWFLIDGGTHLSIELGYAVLALGPTAAGSDSLMGFIWREYGRADSRWAGRDPTIIAIELLTVGLGPFCLWAAYAIYARKPYRHLLQIVVSTAELYGGWMTFVPDILDGGKSLATDDPLLLWVYLVFMNGVWVVVPLLLLWESGAHVVRACDVAKAEQQPRRDRVPGLPSLGWFYLMAGTLLVYIVSVPLIIFLTADPPPARP